MPEILEASPRPGRHAFRFPHISAGLGRRILRHAIPPLCSGQACAVRPNLAPPDQARSRPAPRRPARPQAASNVCRSLIIGHQGCSTCQVRANATGRGRRRVPTLASGAPPRERKDAVWAGFELAGGLRVLRARSRCVGAADGAGVPALSAAPTRHAYFDGTAGTPSVCRAVLAAVLVPHALQTCVRLCGCAGGSYPSHPASPAHQPHGSEALGVNEPQPRDHKLASVAYWHEPAVRAERNRIRHIPDGQRAPGDVRTRL